MSVIKLDLKRADLEVANEVFLELERAISKFPTFNAVLMEEVDELWDEIKRREPNHTAIREEAIQVAAMAIRFIRDVCDR
jgi:hypothetical protein